MAGPTHQFDLLQNIVGVGTQRLACLWRIQALHTDIIHKGVTLALHINMDSVGIEVVNAAKLAAHANRPVNGRGLDFQQR